MGDMAQILLLTAATCLAIAVLGGVVLRVVRSRSVFWSIVVAALVPLLAVTASVVVNVQLMFISSHDSTAVSVALACASVIGVLLSFVLGRRVSAGSRRLTSALRDLATPAANVAPWTGSSDDGTAPAEIAGLAAELELTRARLASAQERASAIEGSRRELVAFMSHDLRTPLAGLRALAEGLEDGVIDDAPAALRQMRQTVDRMNGLVGDLFELSRLQAGTSPRTQPRTMVSLLELSQDIVGELGAHASRRGVQLRLESADDDRLGMPGDADHLARALTNLMGNAIRHTGPGGTVHLSARRDALGGIRLSVTDGCGGIPEPDLDRLFDVGWRAAPERGTEDAGAGLGLAIAKGVVESHGGTIAVMNVPGGCRFDVVLPSETMDQPDRPG